MVLVHGWLLRRNCRPCVLGLFLASQCRVGMFFNQLKRASLHPGCYFSFALNFALIQDKRNCLTVSVLASLILFGLDGGPPLCFGFVVRKANDLTSVSFLIL